VPKDLVCDARLMSTFPGSVAFLGGADVGDPAIAAALFARARGHRVAVIPTAAAFSHPEKAALEVAEWLSPHGGLVEALMASNREDAQLGDLAARLQDADLIYLTDGSALHLRTVLRSTALLEGIEAVLERGGLVAASGGAATVLCDPMIDPRGGAPTVGLGLVDRFCVLTHLGEDDDRHLEKLHRAISLCPAELPVIALGPGAGLFVGPHEDLEAFGGDQLSVYRGGAVLSGGLGELGAR
jgi:cyanophycinase